LFTTFIHTKLNENAALFPTFEAHI